jgi:hypothetical protein
MAETRYIALLIPLPIPEKYSTNVISTMKMFQAHLLPILYTINSGSVITERTRILRGSLSLLPIIRGADISNLVMTGITDTPLVPLSDSMDTSILNGTREP